jgi:hypothetical protein
MKKISKYLPTPLVLLAFLLGFTSIYAVGSPILQDNDMGWHIRVGDLILSTGQIPKHDSWSFSGSKQTWYNLSWIWDVILSLINQKFGMEGLFIFSCACPSLLVALLLASIRKRYDIGVNALIFIGVITTYCMFEFATGRPQIVGMFFALFFHHILHKYRFHPDNPQNIRVLFLLPLIMILWVNIHGSFFAAFIILGAFGLDAIYNKQYAVLRNLLIVSAACLISLLVNPYGIHIIDAVLRALDSAINQYIKEWLPFVFGNSMGYSMWILVFICFSNLRGSDSSVADKILALLWLVATLFSVRNIGFLAVLGAPYLATNLPRDNVKDKHTRKLAAWINDLRFSPAIMSGAILAIISAYYLLPVIGADHYIEKAENSPVPAINYVMQNYAEKRVLNDYDLGGRVIYESKGKLPVFIDGRSSILYSEKIIKDFLDFYNLKEGWQKIIGEYNIDVILVGNNSLFAKNYGKGAYHEEWQQVYHDEVASVYTKKNNFHLGR